MKKSLIVAIGALALMAACKGNKTEPQDSTTTDSLTTDSIIAMADTTPPPAFLYYYSPDNMTVLYWRNVESPDFTADTEEDKAIRDEMMANWQLQDRIRRNAATYTRLYLDNEHYETVSYVDEQLKNPDGGDLPYGIIHNQWNRGAGLNYAFKNPNNELFKQVEYGGLFVLISDLYLKTHKMLDIEGFGSDDEEEYKEYPMPKDILDKLTKQYGLKVDRSVKYCLIGKRYIYGVVQFKPKGDKVMALDVIYDQKDDKLYLREDEAPYNKEDNNSTWNVDDGGIFYCSDIAMAFDGPNGLEIAFTDSAPESLTMGLLFLSGKEIKRVDYDSFYVYVDEGKPFWKKDFAELVKLYNADDHDNKYNTLTKWAWIDIDNDDIDEIWLRDKEGKAGAFFSMKDGKPKLICTEGNGMTATVYDGHICISGPAGGPSYYYANYILEKSRLAHTFTRLEIYGDLSEAHLDGREMSADEAGEYFNKLSNKVHWQNEPYFQSIDKEE